MSTKQTGKRVRFTNQQTFDIVVKHLRKQGKRATSPETNTCQYRIKCKGKILKCAAGCLIPLKLYKPSLEGKMAKITNGPGKILRKLGHNLDLLTELQQIHDRTEVNFWEDKLKILANTWGLTYSEQKKSK
jgi:hypothetical protein